MLIHGVDRPSLEWSETGVNVSAGDFQLMAQWNAHIVRIATNQCFWLADTTGTGYQQTVGQAITWAEAAGLAVIIDLHWSNPPENTANPAQCAQQAMADTNSVTFWQQVAAKYASDPLVSFELYSEPFMGNGNPTGTDWILWQNGGTYNNAGSSQTNTFAGTFQAAGMQQLYNAVRGAGANNMVILGGLNWAYDLSGVTSHPITGTNIAYSTHPYSFDIGICVQNRWQRTPRLERQVWQFRAVTPRDCNRIRRLGLLYAVLRCLHDLREKPQHLVDFVGMVLRRDLDERQ